MEEQLRKIIVDVDKAQLQLIHRNGDVFIEHYDKYDIDSIGIVEKFINLAVSKNDKYI
jgi:hypothetical protein